MSNFPCTDESTPLRILLLEEEPVAVEPVRELLAAVEANPFELDRIALPVPQFPPLMGGDIDVAVFHHRQPDRCGLRSFQKAFAGTREAPVKVLTGFDGGFLSVKALQEAGRGCLVTGQHLDSWSLRLRLSRALQRARRRRARRAAQATREELRIAREIQQKLFPAAPCVEGFDIGGASYPAALTGGDYFDFIPLPDGALGIVVGDVSGHGFGPALLMASTRAYLRGLAQTYVDPTEILTRANRVLADDTGGEPYVTLLFARLDPRTGSLVYASAGHPTGYVASAAGAVKERLESTAIPLGLYPDADFSSSGAVALEPGDSVLLLTDGILEARAPNGALFGEKRALDTLRVYRSDPARQLVDNLYHTVRAFTQNRPQHDDITAVSIKAQADA